MDSTRYFVLFGAVLCSTMIDYKGQVEKSQMLSQSREGNESSTSFYGGHDCGQPRPVHQSDLLQV